MPVRRRWRGKGVKLWAIPTVTVEKSCRRIEGGFLCVTQKHEHDDTGMLGRLAQKWHRHNRWRKWRILGGGKSPAHHTNPDTMEDQA